MSKTSGNVLEVTDAKQAFRTGFWMRRVEILHGVSLVVRRGSIFGFLGANGAGKTTLIHLIAGLRAPAAGRVTIAVGDARVDAVQPAARAKIGYLPERPYFHEHLTGEGLLRYFGALAGMTRAEVLARIDGVLALVGMKQARKVELKSYSKGMLQRIGIAQALLHDPELLVLDEPMSGLDPLGRKEMRELILRLAAEGHTVFFSSHVIPDVETICDQVALLQKGRLIGCGPIGEFLARGALHTEIAFSDVPLEQAAAIPEFSSVREIPDGVRAVASGQEAVHGALRKLLAAKARIHWVTPIRPSLEDLFKGEE